MCLRLRQCMPDQHWITSSNKFRRKGRHQLSLLAILELRVRWAAAQARPPKVLLSDKALAAASAIRITGHGITHNRYTSGMGDEKSAVSAEAAPVNVTGTVVSLTPQTGAGSVLAGCRHSKPNQLHGANARMCACHDIWKTACYSSSMHNKRSDQVCSSKQRIQLLAEAGCPFIPQHVAYTG